MTPTKNLGSFFLDRIEVRYRLDRCLYGVLLCALFVSVFFDPSNQIFHLKTILFYCFALISSFLLITSGIDKKSFLVVFVIVFFIPSVLFAVGFYRDINWDVDWALNTVKSHLFFLSFVFFALNPIMVVRYFLYFCLFLSVAIVVLFFCVSMKFGLAMELSKWLTFDVETAKIGSRAYGNIVLPMIYYKTSALLIVGLGLLGLVHNKKRFLLMFLFSFALFLSGTRANILAGCLFFIVYVWMFWVRSLQGRAALIMILLPLGSYISFIIMSQFLSPDEFSNMVKSLHLQSYMDAFSEDSWAFFVGQGFGSGFYSIYHEGVVYETELTLLELLRRGGGGALLVFCLIFLYPIFKAKGYLFKVSFLMYFFVSSTNPLLISSTGMLALAMGYIYILVENNIDPIRGEHV